MRYASLGRIPAKRHVQFRDDGNLLVEEVKRPPIEALV